MSRLHRPNKITRPIATIKSLRFTLFLKTFNLAKGQMNERIELQWALLIFISIFRFVCPLMGNQFQDMSSTSVHVWLSIFFFFQVSGLHCGCWTICVHCWKLNSVQVEPNFSGGKCPLYCQIATRLTQWCLFRVPVEHVAVIVCIMTFMISPLSLHQVRRCWIFVLIMPRHLLLYVIKWNCHKLEFKTQC